MYFLWNLEVTSCGIIGMKHALPVLDSGWSFDPPLPLLFGGCCPWRRGIPGKRQRMGLVSNMEVLRRKKKKKTENQFCQGQLHPNIPSMNLPCQVRMGEAASENDC